MKSKYIILSLALGTLLFASSCKKFLDQDPNSQASDQTTWKSENDANASIAACYSLIRSAFNAAITYYAYGDLVSGEFTDVPAGDAAYRDILTYNWGFGVPAANTYDPRLKLRLYSNFYTAITQSNRCLYFIGNMPATAFTGSDDATRQAAKNHYLGEAYFTRAFNYFYISRVWGDVPLVTAYTDSAVTASVARAPQADVLKQAIADAKQALAYLNWKQEGSPDMVVRADKGTTFALLAHIYAWMGDYENCKLACDSVINSGTYHYLDAASYMSIYKGQSPESIFEISQNTTSESMRATDAYSITGVTLVPPYINNSAAQPYWQLDNGLIDYLYSDTNDVRYNKAFVKITTGGGNTYESIKYANIQNVNNSSTNQIAVNNIIVFRLADIQLLRAEALTAKAAPDYGAAMAIVNDLRTTRGSEALPAVTGTDLLNLIMDERGRELFLEGHRTFDLIRLERLTHEQQFGNISTAEFAAGKYYWPVDPTLFSTNTKLTQTPFWIGKMK